MLMIIEILLTARAWKRGWRYWALLPMGLCFSTGLLAGMFLSPAEISNGSMTGLFLLVELMFMAALVFMNIRLPRGGLSTSRTTQKLSTPETATL